MNTKLYLIYTILFFFCFFSSCNTDDAKLKSIKSTVYKISSQVERDKNFYLLRLHCYYDDTLNKIFFSYAAFQRCSCDEAKKLLIETVEDLLISINPDKNLNKYLGNYPFNANNVSVYIKFYENGSKPRWSLSSSDYVKSDGHISEISLQNGKIRYMKYISSQDWLVQIKEEDYGEPYKESKSAEDIIFDEAIEKDAREFKDLYEKKS